MYLPLDTQSFSRMNPLLVSVLSWYFLTGKQRMCPLKSISMLIIAALTVTWPLHMIEESNDASQGILKTTINILIEMLKDTVSPDGGATLTVIIIMNV